jgi:amidohydrolase
VGHLLCKVETSNRPFLEEATVDLKNRVRNSLLAHMERLVDLSCRIHAAPEVGFEEVNASAWIADLLRVAGFAVEKPFGGLPTAFAARYGSGPLHLVLCAEYDALQGIGHACGHNLIAAMSVGAGLALLNIANELELSITVLGTPAEEVGDASGKIILLEQGAFQSAHMAMMVHPAPHDSVDGRYLAASMFTIEYFGRPAHASASPQLGVNAADAMTIAQTAIGLLRQQLNPYDRISGIVTHGGDAPNIIPAYSSAHYNLRSKTLQDLKQLSTRVIACFEAGALASGARLAVTGGSKPYAELRQDPDLVALYRANAERLGRKFIDHGPWVDSASASTDLGNVSQSIPCIHPCIGINSLPAVNHQPAFADRCIGAVAERAIHDGALAMAWTTVDIALNTALRQRLLRGSKSVAACEKEAGDMDRNN